MTRYQTNIIWLGLILIVLNIIVNIGEFKSILFGGPSGNGGNTGSGVTPPQHPPLAPGPMNPIVTTPNIQPTPSQNLV